MWLMMDEFCRILWMCSRIIKEFDVRKYRYSRALIDTMAIAIFFISSHPIKAPPNPNHSAL
jgi:hypothetical protein